MTTVKDLAIRGLVLTIMLACVLGAWYVAYCVGNFFILCAFAVPYLFLHFMMLQIALVVIIRLILI